jgi:hypothetical protein
MTKNGVKILICLIGLSLSLSCALAQEPEQIASDIIDQFQPAQEIDYADFDIDINIGWFVANPSATELVVFDNHQTLHKFVDGQLVDSWQYVTDAEQLFSIIDGVYLHDTFYIMYTIDDTFWINDTPLTFDGFPLEMGVDEDYLYVETQVDNELVMFELDDTLAVVGEMTIPTHYDEPVMRIGRIDYPIIVQSTLTGHVSIYDFDTLIGDYQVSDVPTALGHVNAPQTHFVWADPESTHLNLLDIATGENHVIADLDGKYAQYYLLSHDASLAMAINVDFEPIIVAWDTQTGERYDLGAYRTCARIPDKTKLSADGTTLIIGCNTGFELWRIVDSTD